MIAMAMKVAVLMALQAFLPNSDGSARLLPNTHRLETIHTSMLSFRTVAQNLFRWKFSPPREDTIDNVVYCGCTEGEIVGRLHSEEWTLGLGFDFEFHVGMCTGRNFFRMEALVCSTS
jgi:hypothetical protein